MELLLTVSATADRQDFGSTDHISPVHLGDIENDPRDGGILCQFNWRQQQRSFRLNMNGSCRKFRLPYQVEEDSSNVSIDFYDTSNRFAVPLLDSDSAGSEKWFTLDGECQGNIGVRLEYSPSVVTEPFPALGDGEATVTDREIHVDPVLLLDNSDIMKPKDRSGERIIYETIVKNAELEHSEAVPDHVVSSIPSAHNFKDFTNDFEVSKDNKEDLGESVLPMQATGWMPSAAKTRPPVEGVAAHSKIIIGTATGEEVTEESIKKAGWDGGLSEFIADFRGAAKFCTTKDGKPGVDASVSALSSRTSAEKIE